MQPNAEQDFFLGDQNVDTGSYTYTLWIYTVYFTLNQTIVSQNEHHAVLKKC